MRVTSTPTPTRRADVNISLSPIRSVAVNLLPRASRRREQRRR
jgi:hypothetical protein